MSRYHELTDLLFSLSGSSDSAPPFHLAQAIGNPQNDFPSIHIAGTNGKGSVAYKIAESLTLAGYRVGLFTSPHLFTYRERIQINGELITEEEVVEGLEKLFKIAKTPRFFEMTTLLAFDYFSKKEVDIAIVEAGLGGRLDATNIVRPILSIITSIDFDHTEILGETLDEIATEKAGIIKKDVPVVIGQNATLEPILEKADTLYIARAGNIAIAREALKHIPFASEKGGLRKRPPCRYERDGDLIFDVAHNPAAFTYLFDRLKRDFPGKKIHLLLGLSRNREMEGTIALIRRHVDRIVLIPVDHPRLIPTEELKDQIPEAAILSPLVAYAEAKAAGALTLVSGSCYIMSTIAPLRTSSSLH